MSGPITVSFEFFPPKTEAMEATLWESVGKLSPLNPTFVSVTYGAGGSTRERTHRTVKRMLDETGLLPAAHVTCVAASKADVDSVLADYWAAGVRHIVALRGDPPAGIGTVFEKADDGYANATEVTAAAKRVGDFEISVGVYPEVHPESPGADHDLDVLKAKIDAGATRGISQFFIEPATFLRYRDRCAAAGIAIPLIPGIMPVGTFKGLVNMAKGCGANIPPWFADLFHDLDDDPETRKLVAATAAADLCRALYAEGVDHFHFYTLNRAEQTLSACRQLGVRPAAAIKAEEAAQ